MRICEKSLECLECKIEIKIEEINGEKNNNGKKKNDNEDILQQCRCEISPGRKEVICFKHQHNIVKENGHVDNINNFPRIEKQYEDESKDEIDEYVRKLHLELKYKNWRKELYPTVEEFKKGFVYNFSKK
ncbi:unnamed protein product [Rhizophagus irregularis]|nr:unnamed protein product [Rhizophagus irregularis]